MGYCDCGTYYGDRMAEVACRNSHQQPADAGAGEPLQVHGDHDAAGRAAAVSGHLTRHPGHTVAQRAHPGATAGGAMARQVLYCRECHALLDASGRAGLPCGAVWR